MKARGGQQILIGGVGGQGVLFVTSLLAAAAIRKGLPVITSETHGMAQRGGTVVSHLKAGDFASPMIRPGQGHVLLALKQESVEHHEAFLRSDAWIVVNGSAHRKATRVRYIHPLKADDIAREIGHPKSANLVLLGFALARGEDRVKEGQRLYCSLQDVKSALEERLAGREDLRKACIQALEAGHGAR